MQLFLAICRSFSMYGCVCSQRGRWLQPRARSQSHNEGTEPRTGTVVRFEFGRCTDLVRWIGPGLAFLTRPAVRADAARSILVAAQLPSPSIRPTRQPSTGNLPLAAR